MPPLQQRPTFLNISDLTSLTRDADGCAASHAAVTVVTQGIDAIKGNAFLLKLPWGAGMAAVVAAAGWMRPVARHGGDEAMATTTGHDAGPRQHEPAVSVVDTGPLARYITVLTSRFAAHGSGDALCRCRCGSARPCEEELRVAELLDLIAGACR
jgi:hypothetical protein